MKLDIITNLLLRGNMSTSVDQVVKRATHYRGVQRAVRKNHFPSFEDRFYRSIANEWAQHTARQLRTQARDIPLIGKAVYHAEVTVTEAKGYKAVMENMAKLDLIVAVSEHLGASVEDPHWQRHGPVHEAYARAIRGIVLHQHRDHVFEYQDESSIQSINETVSTEKGTENLVGPTSTLWTKLLMKFKAEAGIRPVGVLPFGYKRDEEGRITARCNDFQYTFVVRIEKTGETGYEQRIRIRPKEDAAAIAGRR